MTKEKILYFTERSGYYVGKTLATIRFIIRRLFAI